MFEALGSLGNIGNLVRQAKEMGGRMQEMNDQLKAKRVTGSSGGGMVQVEANGLGEVLRLEIDPQLIERQERDMIEDLVPAAVNQAVSKAREAHAELMKSMTDGINVPGVDIEQMLSKLTNPSDK